MTHLRNLGSALQPAGGASVPYLAIAPTLIGYTRGLQYGRQDGVGETRG